MKLKYICQVFIFQDGRNRPYEVTGAMQVFHSVYKSQSGFLLHFFIEQIKKLFYLQFYGKMILFQLFTFWFYCQSENIYKNFMTNNKISSKGI
jgi:hypothetical protein